MSSKRAASWSYAMNWAQQGFNALFVFVLAGLLGPEAFGTVAIASIFVAFLQILVEQGASLPLVQKRDLTKEHEDSAFWALWVWSLLLIGLAVVAAPIWGEFNNTPLAGQVVLALAPIVLFQGFCVVPRSRMIRGLRFRALTVVMFFASLFGGSAGVIAAIAGADVWSLVIQQWVTVTITTVLVWATAGYRPHASLSRKRLQELLPLASGSALHSLGSFAHGRVDAILIGLFFGPVAVGLYRLSHRMVQLALTLLTRPLMAFALPYLAARQHDPGHFREGASKLLSLSMTLAVPFLGIVAVLSPLIVGTIGPDWSQAWVALSGLAIVGIVQSFVLFTPQFLNAAGRSHTAAGVTWLSAVVSGGAFGIAAFTIQDAPLIEQLGVVVGVKVAVSILFALPFHMAVIRHATGLSLWSQARVLMVPLGCGALGVGLASGLIILDPLQGSHVFVKLVSYGSLSYLVSGGAILIVDRRILVVLRGIGGRIAARRKPGSAIIAQADTGASQSG